MNKVTIDRELLERELLSVLDFSESNLRRVVDHLIDVGYTLAAPRQPAEVGELVRLLDQLANGSHLDSVSNHDDDSLRELAYRCDGGLRKHLLRHADRIDAALAKLEGKA